MTNKTDKLSSSEISSTIQNYSSKFEIRILDETYSTNNYAFQLASDGAPEGVVIFAEKQTGGRGRLKRKWDSPAYQNLYFSVILRPAVSVEMVPQITLVTGYAIYQAIKNMVPNGLRLKWPNDLWVHSKKICGILSEVELDKDNRVKFVIVGIGLNVNAEPKDFSKEVAPIATSLYLETKEKQSKSKIAGLVLDSLYHEYEEYLKNGFLNFREKWEKAANIQGKKVKVLDPLSPLEGVCEGLDSSGALLVRDGEKLHPVIAGDVLFESM